MTIEDARKSFEQILSAFTLEDKRIDAVVGRIDTVKHQMSLAGKNGEESNIMM
jgi:hypothetical protein